MNTREHELKCWPPFFAAIEDGDKTFEVRKNDRGFQRGDVLWLREYEPEKHANNYTGAEIRKVVTYVLSGWGVEPGYVVLGLASVEGRP